MSSREIIVDTNVISYFIKGTTQAELYWPHTERRVLTMSFISVGELYLWAERGVWGETRRRELDVYISKYGVIPYDTAIARYYAKISAECRNKGRTISSNDVWIAACAARRGIPLLTHNKRDFEHIDSIEVISEA